MPTFYTLEYRGIDKLYFMKEKEISIMNKGIYYGVGIVKLINETRATLKSLKVDVENDIRLGRLGSNPVAGARKSAFFLDMIDYILGEMAEHNVDAFNYNQYYTMCNKAALKKFINRAYRGYNFGKFINPYNYCKDTVINCALFEVTDQFIGKLNKVYSIDWDNELHIKGENFGSHLVAETCNGSTQDEVEKALEADGFESLKAYSTEKDTLVFIISKKRTKDK